MGVYINGLKVPKLEKGQVIKAQIMHDPISDKVYFGMMTGGYACSEEWTYYSPIEIPSHGRLVDADALKQEYYTANIIHHYGEQILMVIDNAKTVIPAEGEGET